MTEETSSSSSTFGKQDMGHLLKYIGNRTIPLLPPVPLHPRLLRVVESGANLQIPEDILEIVRKFVGWDNLGDVSRAWEKYTFISQGHEYPNFDIKEELEKLKGLSSALGSKYDVYAKEYEKIKIEYEDHFSRLAEQLVEQVPRIKYMPGYEHLTTGTEKFHIEKALRKKVQEVEVEDLDLATHLK
ncbi:hypothetical protein MKW94_018069, partial [Papaver nudicaule]|nr:hypothetical protein [Papaver nudicaule]